MGVVRVPTPVGVIELVADAKRRNVTCRLTIDAPLNRQTYKGRMRWLLNQLPEEVAIPARVDIIWERNQRSSAPLSSFREDLNVGRIDSASGPRGFQLVYVSDLATRFAGSRTFVPAVEEAIVAFYENLAQHVRPWQGRDSMDSEAVTESQDELDERAPPAEPKRKVTQSGKFKGRSFSIFDDGSIEVETENGVQRFGSVVELNAAIAAKNGHANPDRPAG